MRLTKRQLKRIIREEYTRLKRRGLIREYGMDSLGGEEPSYDALWYDLDGWASPSMSMRELVNGLLQLSTSVSYELAETVAADWLAENS